MPREHPTLETCTLCGTSLPAGYPYDLCANDVRSTDIMR